MKNYLLILFSITVFYANAQQGKTQKSAIDYSLLWHGTSILYTNNKSADKFPEPLGYVGKEYKRFQLHYDTVLFNPEHPELYSVKGYTIIDSQKRPFTGTISIQKVETLQQHASDDAKEGIVVCSVHFMEDAKIPGSGMYIGEMISKWMNTSSGRIVYDTKNAVNDNYANNQCIAERIDYKTKAKQPCHWGDFRIPASGDLDIGAGYFEVNPKYKNNGWQDYISNK